jgi:hypothetical protein
MNKEARTAGEETRASERKHLHSNTPEPLRLKQFTDNHHTH